MPNGTQKTGFWNALRSDLGRYKSSLCQACLRFVPCSSPPKMPHKSGLLNSIEYIPATELNHENISQQRDKGFVAIKAKQTVIDFSQTTSVDSSAVVCLLAWIRYAQEHGVKLEFQHLPANLVKLIQLYGVTELLSE